MLVNYRNWLHGIALHEKKTALREGLLYLGWLPFWPCLIFFSRFYWQGKVGINEIALSIDGLRLNKLPNIEIIVEYECQILELLGFFSKKEIKGWIWSEHSIDLKRVVKDVIQGIKCGTVFSCILRYWWIKLYIAMYMYWNIYLCCPNQVYVEKSVEFFVSFLNNSRDSWITRQHFL